MDKKSFLLYTKIEKKQLVSVLMEEYMDFYNFYIGKEFQAYEFLGAHVWEKGVTFRTFAPAAHRVSVIGEFN